MHDIGESSYQAVENQEGWDGSGIILDQFSVINVQNMELSVSWIHWQLSQVSLAIKHENLSDSLVLSVDGVKYSRICFD